ncbi:MAG: DUF1667 domain-containing protein [Clostridia bacterium]|nr:DUF1667 domain-containing protein [Clostridia bacterium]
METVKLTCIECPVGCAIEVVLDDKKVVSVAGNGCPRGKLYAENEVVCPKRVVTSTVKVSDGRLLPVKTDKPVAKTEIFSVMEKINSVTVSAPVRIGDVLIPAVYEDANVVATADID